MAVARAQCRSARRNSNGFSGKRLRGGRCSGSPVQSKRFLWRGLEWKSGVRRNLPRLGNQIQRSRGQRRHVQRLANMASSIRAAAVMMESRARSKIQQGQATHYRQRAPARNFGSPFHFVVYPTPERSNLDGSQSHSVAYLSTRFQVGS